MGLIVNFSDFENISASNLSFNDYLIGYATNPDREVRTTIEDLVNFMESASANDLYQLLASSSANWNSTYTSLNSNSAKYNSNWTTTNTNSAAWSNWQSVSGNYALGSQYVKLSGDNMTGLLTNTVGISCGTLSAAGAGSNYFAGNVGVGTASPSGNLHVVSNTTGFTLNSTDLIFGALPGVINAAGNSVSNFINNFNNATGIYVKKTATGVGDYLAIEDSSSNPILYVKTTGKVGIGTVSPAERLTVSGNISASGTLSAAGAGSNYFAGNVGIGTTAPVQALSIVGGSGTSYVCSINSQVTPGAYIGFVDTTTTDRPLLGAIGNNFAIRTNGVESLRVTSANNVGIGTTGPNFKLQVHDASTQNYIQITNAGTGSASSDGMLIGFDAGPTTARIWNRENIPLDFYTNDTVKMSILANGNVGIGTTSPAERLTVSGNISASGTLSAAGAGSNYFAGNVGVGTASPAKKLDVVGNPDPVIRAYNNASGAGLQMGPDLNNAFLSTIGTIPLQLKINDTERMRIDASGNVGIGTVSPAERLTVSGNISASGTLSAAGAGSNYFAGNVGIGTTAPYNGKLDVRGDIGLSQNNGLYVGDGSTFTRRMIGQDASTILRVGASTGQFASLGLSINNSADLVYLTDAKVGIGTTSPAERLTVSGNISANGNLIVAGNIFGGTNINLLTSTTYIIQLSDNGGTIASSNSTAGLTAVPSTGITYPAGFQTSIIQLSTARVALSSNSVGLSINQANGYIRTTKQYSAATLLYTGTLAGWVLFGDVGA